MIKYFILLAVIISLHGCGPSVRSDKTSNSEKKGLYLLEKMPSGQVPMQYVERIIALDKDTSEALLYINHSQGRVPSGQVRIVVNMQNRHPDKDIWIAWKAVFYDGRDFRIEETEWQKTFFPSLEIRDLKVNSIRKDVKNYTILLKRFGKPN